MVEKSSGLLISWLTGLYSCQKITVTIGKKHQIIHRLMRPELHRFRDLWHFKLS
jgi:hypothetical protein